MPVSPELLHRLALACEENHARQVLKSCTLARLYPSGVVPPSGVRFCRDWLRVEVDEDSFEFHLLNLVEIHDDDQGWSLNGVPQGGMRELLDFILGSMSPEDAVWIEIGMRADYNRLVSEAKGAIQRRAAIDRP